MTADSENLLPLPRNNLEYFSLHYAVCSDVGKRRSENQDSYAVAHSPKAQLYLVADGMGGARGGAVASAIAVNIIARKAFLADGTVTGDSLLAAIQQANTEVYSRSLIDPALSGMGTTVVAFVIVPDGLITAHTGDSRVYRLRGSQLSRLTRDHSLVRELVDSGALTEQEANHHPIGHMLTRSLGTADSVKVDLQVLPEPLLEHEKFLLCCDGLYQHVEDGEMESALSSNGAREASEELLHLALDRGGTDNITIEIVEVFGKDASEIPESMPPLVEDGNIRIALSSHFDLSAPIASPSTEQAPSSAAAAQPAFKERELKDPRPLRDPSEDDGSPKAPPVEGILKDRLEKKMGAKQAPVGKSFEFTENLRSGLVVGGIVGVIALGLLVLVMGGSSQKPDDEPSLLGFLFSRGGSSGSGERINIEDEFAKLENGNLVIDNRSIRERLFGEKQKQDAATASANSAQVENRGAQTSVPQPNPTLVATVTTGESPSSQNQNPTTPPLTLPLDEPEQAQLPSVDAAPPTIPLITSSVPPLTEPGRTPTGQMLEVISIIKTELLNSPDPSEQEIAAAFDLSIPVPPENRIGEEVREPIRWENEAGDVNAIAQGENANNPGEGAATNVPLLAEHERVEILVGKLEVRDQVIDLDGQLDSLNYHSAAERNNAIREANSRSQQLEGAFRIALKRKQLELDRVSKFYQALVQLGQEGDVASVTRSVENELTRVGTLREEFEQASQDYLKAVQRWETGSGDDRTATEMAALGRNVKVKRAELEQVLRKELQRSLNEAKDRFGVFAEAEILVDMKRSQANRKIGA